MLHHTPQQLTALLDYVKQQAEYDIMGQPCNEAAELVDDLTRKELPITNDG